MADEQTKPTTTTCRYCRETMAADALKCRLCGEWAVRTRAGAAAMLLRAVGWLWVALSALGALATWRLTGALRSKLLGAYVDEYLATPRVVDPFAYALIFLILLQGLTIGLGLMVFAGLAPRRPR